MFTESFPWYFNKNLSKLHKINISFVKNKFALNISSCHKVNYTGDYKYFFFFKSFFNSKYDNTCFFLRKSKFFNKGRYSRNRQIYRTGVYLCFYINIIVLYLVWFVFYKASLKFTYLWWVFFLLPSSLIFSRSLKYGLIFPKEFLFYTNLYLNWLCGITGYFFYKNRK